MSLQDLDLKHAYDSDSDNLLIDFYIPALSEASSYKRIAGYFSSNALAIAAKGIAKFINENNGSIELIANVVLSETDVDAISAALKEKEKEILEDIDNIEDELKRDHIKVLGWLIKKGLLEIKIASVSNGIAHQKMGIFEDNEGNIVSFSGSDNETVMGWIHNDELFHVYCNWREGDISHLTPDIDRFNKYWSDTANKVNIHEVSDALKEGLIRIAPKNDSEFKRLSIKLVRELIAKNNDCHRIVKIKKLSESFDDKLWGFQREALTNWHSRSNSGIISMATGTGKTKTAIGGIFRLLTSKQNLAVIICCPQNSILRQWEEEITELDAFDLSIVADGSNSNWLRDLSDGIIDLNRGKAHHVAIYTTYNTLYSERFITQSKKIKHDVLLVCDEVHWAGANEFKKGLLDRYKYRLGLSATPDRYMDDEGTDFIKEYFRGVVFEFGIDRALSELNPSTNETFLCPYDYRPIFISLDPYELDEYLEITDKIKTQYARDHSKEGQSEYLRRLLEKRVKIINNAEGKYLELTNLLNSFDKVYFLLIYCSDKQIQKAQEILAGLNIINHKFTGSEDISPKKEFGGISERSHILNHFENKTYQALVAMKCLDEGINIKRAETAILLASSGNSREFIQRRGRILRRHPDKMKAVIYDIIVLPYLDEKLARHASEDELKIVKRELNRYGEFADLADNQLEVVNKIYEIQKLYGFREV